MDIQFTIAPDPAIALPFDRAVQFEIHYTELIQQPDTSIDQVARTIRIELGPDLKASTLLKGANDKGLQASILNIDGTTLLTRDVKVTDGVAGFVLLANDIKEIRDSTQSLPSGQAPLYFPRAAQLVPTGTVKPDFANSQMAVAVITAQTDLVATGVADLLRVADRRVNSIEVTGQDLGKLNSLVWSAVHIAVDGRFTTSFEQQTALGWVWWLTGDFQILGFVPDELSKPNPRPIVIALPVLKPKNGAAPTEDVNCEDCSAKVPANVTEAEVANNPGVYSEDPGTFCKPFSNPERVLSERAFSVIARITQPDIGPLGSIRTRSQYLLNLDALASSTMVAAAPVATTIGAATSVLSPHAITSAIAGIFAPTRAVTDGSYTTDVGQMPSGRTKMDAQHPLQWEDDIAQYQASTVSLGHILEFRVRWRSNGYSLGTVASTLTLAPRQTKRIQKISFERAEQARRQESTSLSDQVNDQNTRDRDYSDAVAGNLSEWASGSSSSSTASVAGGFGFFAPGILGGVGGGASTARSSSQSEGGRDTAASEEQRLRDAIRRHGDALRKFDSTVVSEIRQEETVTGTTEIVRNPNYGHSLTVIYYQILRHLKVNTEFAGVRECLYVPFAIKPFNIQRTYRWREAIQRSIRTPRFARAFLNLRDVLTNFTTSNIPIGPRAAQRVTFLRGSIYVSMAIARPKDDGTFDAAAWSVIGPFLGMPAYGIFAALMAKSEAQRDSAFQAEHAPTIAAKWANVLTMKVGNVDLQPDFTLATRYGFNQTVRIDFTVPFAQLNAHAITRENLVEINVNAGSDLTPGSIANLSRMTINYTTDHYERSVNGESSVDDLVNPGTGAKDHAIVSLPLDSWERVDERLEMTRSVGELIEHLNEHVEYYHKAIWWDMDRDRLLMMLDGFYVPGVSGNVSIASVVDRDPLGIIGNCLVYRVGVASYIGYGEVDTPEKLRNVYVGHQPIVDPLLISVPTDGLYAQTIMDECLALEEHQGSVDWVLDDPDPDLGTIDPSLLTSRRADTTAATTPTQLPSTIINLQNTPEAPATSGLQGVLNAVTNPNAFRDMAGLAGTQANAAAALQAAAGMATNFGNQAAALKLAEMAKNKQATQDVNKQLAAVQKAKDQKMIPDTDVADHTNKILGAMHSTGENEQSVITGKDLAQELIKSGQGGSIAETNPTGSRVVDIKPPIIGGDASFADDSVERGTLLGGGNILTTDGTERFVVIVSGYNMNGHDDSYAELARNRARVLASQAAFASDNTLIFIWFSVTAGKVFMNRLSGGSWKLRAEKDWTAIDELDLNNGTKKRTVTYAFEKVDKSKHYGTNHWMDQTVANTLMSITDIYGTIEALGDIHPGKLIEFSILSHGWTEGPVLLNTDDNSSTTQRDPSDKDGRTKDFLTVNMPTAELANFKNAFEPTSGRSWIWGCSVSPGTRAILQGVADSKTRRTAWGRNVTPVDAANAYKADGTTDPAAEFKFDVGGALSQSQGHDPASVITLLTAFYPAGTAPFVKQFSDIKTLAQDLAAVTYCDHLAKASGNQCFGPGVGTSSNYATSDPYRPGTPVVHWVEQGKARPAPESGFEADYRPLIEFYDKTLGMTQDGENRGYIRFAP